MDTSGSYERNKTYVAVGGQTTARFTYLQSIVDSRNRKRSKFKW